jgi:hypothetical protein
MKTLILCLFLFGLAEASMPPGIPSSRGTEWYPCAMTRYSAPLKLGWVLGVAVNHPLGRFGHHGPFFQLEPGFGGGKVNIGYRYGQANILPLLNVGLCASVLQTWGNPLGDVKPGQTYLGLEASLAVYVVGFNAGVFHHISGDDSDLELIYTLGAAAGI